MQHDITDLQRLAVEAAREAYSPRALKCWPWSHQWSTWEPLLVFGRLFESRGCLRCGRTKTKAIRF